jgi:hypothetical protein
MNRVIPDAKDYLKIIAIKLRDNKFCAYVTKPSKCLYLLKAKEKIVLSIAIINNTENNTHCLQLCFKNGLDSICVDNIEDFKNAIDKWYEEFMDIKNLNKSHQNYIRKGIYSIEDVLSKTIMDDTKGRNDLIEFDGDKIHMASDRYKTFLTSGTKCVDCGLEAKYFAKERDWKQLQYHFNLYGVNDNGEEILFTKDHVIPKSKGGKNELSNYQTMCSKCNELKGNGE